MNHMTKIHYLFLFFLFITQQCCLSEIINKPDNHVKFTPENTVFMFDVDGVLVERGFWQNWHDYWNILQECNTFDLIKFFSWHLLHLPTLLTVVNQEDIEKYLDQQAKDWPFLLKKTPTGTILERLKATISKGKPKQEIIDILLDLHSQGFPITIATNQTRNTFDRLVNSDVVPDFSMYTMILTADHCPCVPYIKKPQKEYYQCFKKKLSQQGLEPEHYIFIDDTYENVIAAAKEGIVSIYFDTRLYHASQQLICDLATLRITVAQEFSRSFLSFL